MTRQLSTLVSAGCRWSMSLGSIDQVDSERLKRISVRRERQRGQLAGRRPDGAFQSVQRALRQHGARREASGALDVVLLRLADYTESTARLRRKLASALTYPIIMVLVGGAILFFLLSYVVPKITRIFTESKQVLPLPTRALIATSTIFATWWPLLLFLLIAGAFAARYYVRTPGGRARYDRWLLSVPVFGKLLQKIAVARFSRTLSTLLQSGIGLLPSSTSSRTSSTTAFSTRRRPRATPSAKDSRSLRRSRRAASFRP
jgi:general secretion pathway protein F